MKIEHHVDVDVVAVQLVDGPDDYGREIAEGVVAHFKKTPEGEEDILMRIEIEEYPDQGRDTSRLEFETFGEKATPPR